MLDDTPSGLLLFLISFGILVLFVISLWGINIVVMPASRRKMPVPRSPFASTKDSAVPAEQVPQLAAASLPLPVWLDMVNNQPDRVPHLAAKGPSGSGKTTLIQAALMERPGKILICTPKNARDDPWGGAPAVRLTAELTFDAIERALQQVHHDVKRRNVEGFNEWLTVVIDDYPWVAQECPSAAKIVTLIGNMGRSVRVRLILLAQTATVKAWGFEGNGEARTNFVFLDLEEDHQAVLYRWGKAPQAIDTSAVRDLARHAIAVDRWWPLPPEEHTYTLSAAASGPVAPLTEQHVRVAAWLMTNPAISTRELARRLYPGTDGGGDYSTRTKAVRLSVEQLLGNTLLAVQTPDNTQQEANANT